MSLSKEQCNFARDISMLIVQINLKGYDVTFGEALRTQEQADLYAKEGKGIHDSLHCKKLAIDLNLFKDDAYITDYKEYEQFGKYWESLDPLNRWGGYFVSKYGGHIVDSDHYERNVK
jgi:hypothetical protein